MLKGLLSTLLWLLFTAWTAMGYTTNVTPWMCGVRAGPLGQRQPRKLFLLMTAKNAEDDDINSIRLMKIKDLKSELDASRVSHSDVFEKEELVRRVVALRARRNVEASAGNDVTRETTPSSGASAGFQPPESSVIAPLFILSTQDRELKLANDMTMSVARDQDAQFCAIQIKIPNSNAAEQTLTLLVDTACSGFVLRPSVPARCGLPLYNSPTSTMTGASGATSELGQISQISRFYVEDSQQAKDRRPFGPLPAALQDIGALPAALDGILGLSFLSQFVAFDFDFGAGALVLHTESLRSASNEGFRAPLRLIGNYGIYSVDVFIDGRGPISLLLDTGASNTLINSEGVNGLGLDMSDLEKLSQSTGALGVDDGMAMAITHRIWVKDSLCLGKNGENSLSVGKNRFELSVAEIPILNGMPGVVGIMGIDALRLCQNLRISCKQPAFISILR